jgi:hypothetical protein
MLGMWYLESESIAKEHQEISEQIQLIDDHLYRLGTGIVRLEPTADILNIDPSLLDRILQLYVRYGCIDRIQASFCPMHDELLERSNSEELYCYICEMPYDIDTCRNEIIYQVERKMQLVTGSTNPYFKNGYALIVGIAHYQHLRPLSKTVVDADDFQNLLLTNGFPRDNVILIPEGKATRANISDRFNHLAKVVASSDTMIFFFSGHGLQRVGGFERGEYLCPVDAHPDNLVNTAISDDNLTEALNSIKASKKIIFLDACHSGGVGRTKDADIGDGFSEEAYKKLSAGQGTAIIASCKPGEYSYEVGTMRNGVFTTYLLEALRGQAAPAGRDYVRIYDLLDYVQEKVPQCNPDQHPLFKGDNIDSNFVVVMLPKKKHDN